MRAPGGRGRCRGQVIPCTPCSPAGDPLPPAEPVPGRRYFHQYQIPRPPGESPLGLGHNQSNDNNYAEAGRVIETQLDAL